MPSQQRILEHRRDRSRQRLREFGQRMNSPEQQRKQSFAALGATMGKGLAQSSNTRQNAPTMFGQR